MALGFCESWYLMELSSKLDRTTLRRVASVYSFTSSSTSSMKFMPSAFTAKVRLLMMSCKKGLRQNSSFFVLV